MKYLLNFGKTKEMPQKMSLMFKSIIINVQ